MRILKLVQTMIAAVLLVIVLFLLGGVFIPKWIGYKPYNIVTGSMEPAYPVGSMVYVKEVSMDKIKVGDVITFQNSSVITHRVVRVDNDNNMFFTKGDANTTEDGAVSFEKVIGKASGFSIPYIGQFLDYFQNRKQIAIGIVIGLTMIWFLMDFIKKPNTMGGEEQSD